MMTHTIDEWTGCYPSNWKGVIVPGAMTHPAKYSSKLIRRIYDHIAKEGWVQKGDRVVDPFGGVALGALDAMRLGLNWYGNELEEKFWNLGNANIGNWLAKFPHLSGSAHLSHGDSRKLIEGLGAELVSVALSSPPYADSDQDYKGGWKRFHDGHEPLFKNDMQREAQYGQTNGQLSAMKATGFDVAVSSPLYEGVMSVNRAGNADQVIPSIGKGGAIQPRVYGNNDAQLGNDSGNDFWLAARTIVEQVYLSLVPGGHAVWVVKDYVKSKKIVPFCDQWRQLCESVGFVTLHEHHAMLVHHKGAQHGFDGSLTEYKTESKSFFRRLAEKKGSPRIDWETVLCMVKK